ncbi:MAG: DNA polymerase/3'-5' exonuclease PolX [Chloroflexi bacterium]|nr:DNA polymerase/3'-5' exonuclease PolX [Chloroflexota bacterium]
MDNPAVAQVFENIGKLLEVQGDSPFKIRAYQRVAREIDHLPGDINTLAAQDKLRTIPGVGEEIEKKIRELLATGRLNFYQRLLQELPGGLVEMMEVPGLGPKMAARMWKELGVTTLPELEAALQDGRVAALPRMGAKTAENLLHQLEALRGRKAERVPLGEARPVAEAIVAALSRASGARNVTAAGSIRRWRDTVGDIDILATADDPQSVTDAFVGLPEVAEVLSHGPQRASIRLKSGLQVDLLLKPHASYASLLQHFTGSREHNILLRERAQHMGLSMGEYGLTEAATGKLETFLTEEALYQRLGLQYIPPELREGGDEVLRAECGRIPRLVELPDLRGDLHAHTEWSDGHTTIEAMAEAARARGYQYLAITDHSAGLGIARGLAPERLREQLKIIRELNQSYAGSFRILTGSEVDIRADGTLDFPDDLLAELDVVVASVHSAMGQDLVKMTDRVLRAMANPHMDIFGHPTTRLIGQRDPIQLDIEAVFQAALATHTALEVNASPSRLDLKDAHVRRAVELGIPLAISTDAHHPDQLAQMPYGVATARRGWAEPSHVLNTGPLQELLAFLGRA